MSASVKPVPASKQRLEVTGSILPRPLIERGCTLGCGAACGTVGLFVQRGDYGDPPDAATAETWYRRGCQLEDGWSCFRLGELTSDGPTRSHGCDLLDTACPDRTY